MKIKTLSLTDFRAFPGPAPATFELDGKNLLLYGENGSGKSSLFHALRGFFSLGNRTHYTLINHAEAKDGHPEQGKRPFEGGNQASEGGKQALEGGKRNLPPLPPELAQRLPAPGQRVSEVALRYLIRDLCEWQALRGEELATLLGKDLKYLRNKHLSAMIQTGELVIQNPESPNHKLQAYKRAKTDEPLPGKAPIHLGQKTAFYLTRR